MKLRLFWIPLMSAAILAGGDFWQEKDPSQWTGADAAAMLTNSPWAKKVTLERAGPRPPGPLVVGAPTSRESGLRGLGGDATTRGGGFSGWGGGGSIGPAGETGPLVMRQLILRWEGAAPVRAARSHSAFPADAAAQLAGYSRDYYVITLTGLPDLPPMLDGRIEQRGEVRASALPEIRTVSIQSGGKAEFRAEKIERLKTPEGPMLMLLFNRKNTVLEAGKTVSIEADMGRYVMKARFKLKDMRYRGKLEL